MNFDIERGEVASATFCLEFRLTLRLADADCAKQLCDCVQTSVDLSQTSEFAPIDT